MELISKYDFQVIENTDKYLKINEINIIGEIQRNIINQIIVEKDKMLLDVIYLHNETSAGTVDYTNGEDIRPISSNTNRRTSMKLEAPCFS